MTTTSKTRFEETAASQQELVSKLQLATILGGAFELAAVNESGVLKFKVILPDEAVAFYRQARRLPVW